MNRNNNLLQNLRPTILTKEVKEKNSIEGFQNKVLRPVIKFQHTLLIKFISNQQLLIKLSSKSETDEQLRETIKTFIRKQVALKHSFIGLILGLLTTDEFSRYLENSSEFDKRILQMITQRLFDSRKEWIT